MKKGIVLMMALIFALGLTSIVFAADEKVPVDVKATPGKGVSVPESALTPSDKRQMEEAKKPAAVKKKAVEKPGLPESALTPSDKRQMEEAKKPATFDKKKEAAPAAPAAPAPATQK